MSEFKKIELTEELTEEQKEALKNLVAKIRTGEKPWPLLRKKAEEAK